MNCLSLKKLVVSCLLSFLLIQNVGMKAQIDTSFWFAAPWVTPDHWWKDDVKLHISTFSAPSTTVRFRQPGLIGLNGYDTTFILPPNTTFDYTFWKHKLASSTSLGFDSLETRPSNTVVPYGLYISSSSNITVVYDIFTRALQYFNPETFSLKGQNGLGLEFYCPFQTVWKNQTFTSNTCNYSAGDLNCDGTVTQPKQQINIVASRPNTTIWINSKCNSNGHLANISYSVTLTNPGDAYTIENATQSTNVSGQSLSGTHITSDKPISVTVADDSVADAGCWDLMGDQIVPINDIGKDYVLNKGSMYSAASEGVFIVATQNTTQLTINDGAVITTTTIGQGDTYYYLASQPLTYINADKNVYCLQATGIGCELSEALLPPLNCSGTDLVSFSRTRSQYCYLNILCKNNSTSTFTLNNSSASLTASISASNFSLVPGTSTLTGGPYYGAKLDLTSTATFPVGSYTIGNSSDVFALGIFEGGLTTGTIYHFLSSFQHLQYVNALPDFTVCNGSSNTVSLTGTVSGDSFAGSWTTANGTGTFAPYSSTNTVISTTYSISAADTLLNSLKFYITSVGNCNPVVDSVTVQINQRPSLLVGSGTSMCKNSLIPVLLTGTVTNAGAASWSGGNGGIFGTGINTAYLPSGADLAAGTITLVLTSQGALPGCANSVKTLTVTFFDIPTLTITPGSSFICFGQSISLTASGSASSYSWNTGSLINSLSVSPSITTVYEATGLNVITGCQSSDSVVIYVMALPAVTINGTNYACLGSSFVFTASGASTYSWAAPSWTASGSIISVAPSVPTQYTVAGTGSNGCIDSSVVNAYILSLPIITASSNRPVLCTGEFAILTGSGGTSYTWTPNTVTPTLVVSPTITTSYNVVAADINGCLNSTAITQSVSLCLGIESNAPVQEPLFAIYPNPSDGEFVIESLQTALNLDLINEEGQTVKKIQLRSANGYQVSIRELPNGIYFIKGVSNGKIISKKVVISR